MPRLDKLKGVVASRAAALATAAAYRGWLDRDRADRLIARYWDNSAAAIAAEWGQGRDDFELLGGLLARLQPESVLDAGCGSGRLFPLYEQSSVKRVVGTDISDEALALARQSWPAATLIHVRLEDLDFPTDSFDLGICNRVLQHVPPHSIQRAVERLAKACLVVYVNEMTDTDQVETSAVMRRYDYDALFGACGMSRLESGRLGHQTYTLYARTRPLAGITG
jgi:SAM-dependent methyltransferase